MDAYVTTQVNHEQYSVARGLAAFGIGALGGAIGAGIVAPAAEAVGIWAATTIWVPNALSPLVGTVAELTTGMFLAGSANAALSTTKRMTMDALDGEKITTDKVLNDIGQNGLSDMIRGAKSFGIGYGAGRLIGDLWQPSETVEPLLNMNPGQKITIGAFQAGATAIGNTDLLGTLGNKKKDSSPVILHQKWNERYDVE